MAASQSGSWTNWSHVNVEYTGTWSASVSRGGTSSTATVTVSVTMTEAWGKGNESDYYLYVNGTQRASNTAIHYQGTSCTLSYTYYPSVGDASGSLTGSLELRAYLPGGAYSSRSASYTLTYGSKTTYTISYNANNGSGAPGAQTKYYNTDITISSTKPTRTGYTFTKWNTNSGGTGTNYNSGAKYSANASATLYAQWQLNSYTISYDANGGSGAPSAQTKYYGIDLSLSSTIPTRTNYDFIGWSTNKNAATATYSAGSTYTTNAGATLYAIWKISTSNIISVTPNHINLSFTQTPSTTVVWKPNDSSFKFRITASIGSYNLTIPENDGFFAPGNINQTSQNFSFDKIWITKILDSNIGQCTLTLQTFDGNGTSLGSDSTIIYLHLPSNLNPTINFNGNIGINGTPKFSSNVFSTLDKLTIPWQFSKYAYNNNDTYGAPLEQLQISVLMNNNGFDIIAYPNVTSGIINQNPNDNLIPGENIITLHALDSRMNSAQPVSTNINVYEYYDLRNVTVKYTPNKTLDITGDIAYVNGYNNHIIKLKIYEENSNNPLTLKIDDNHIGTELQIQEYAKWTQTIGEGSSAVTTDIIYGSNVYSAYQSIYFQNKDENDNLLPSGYTLSNLKYLDNNEYKDLDLDSNTYRFEVTVQDSINTTGITVSCFSAVPVMTFGAGGSKITAHKPATFEQSATFEKGATFEQGIISLNSSTGYNALELWARDSSASTGGRLKFRSVPDSGLLNGYIENKNNELRVTDGSNVRATVDLSTGSFYAPNGIYVQGRRIGSYVRSTGTFTSNGNWGTASYTAQLTLDTPGTWILFASFWLADESTTYRNAYRQLSFTLQSGGGNALWLTRSLGLYQQNSTYNNMFIQQQISSAISITASAVIRPYVHTGTAMTYNVEMAGIFVG